MMTAKKKANLTLSQVKDELKRVARVGEVFIDGDFCRTAWKPRAQTFMKGDDMDYNPESALPLKKDLLRLERIGPFPCATTLWRQRPDMPESGEALLYGTVSSIDAGGKPSNRSYVPPEMTPELERVFNKGTTVVKVNKDVSTRMPTFTSRGVSVPVSDEKQAAVVRVFVPVKDSMGDIAAALEVYTLAQPKGK